MFCIVAATAILAGRALVYGPGDLKGAKGVIVLVEKQGSNASMPSENIKTRVELRLRQAGIRVFDENTKPGAAFIGFFDVQISELTADEIHAAIIKTEYDIFAHHPFIRDRTVSLPIWTGEVILTATSGTIRANIEDNLDQIMDKFCNDYLRDNAPVKQ